MSDKKHPSKQKAKEVFANSKISFVGMADLRMRDDLERLTQEFPARQPFDIRNTYVNAGSLYAARILLHGDQGPSRGHRHISLSPSPSPDHEETSNYDFRSGFPAQNTSETTKVNLDYVSLNKIKDEGVRTKVIKLLRLFFSHHYSVKFVYDVLGGYKNDVNRAAQFLLSMGGSTPLPEDNHNNGTAKPATGADSDQVYSSPETSFESAISGQVSTTANIEITAPSPILGAPEQKTPIRPVNGAFPRVVLRLRNNTQAVQVESRSKNSLDAMRGITAETASNPPIIAFRTPVLRLRPQLQSSTASSNQSSPNGETIPENPQTAKAASPTKTGPKITYITIDESVVDEDITEEKVSHLHDVFPHVSRTRCGHILQIEEGDIKKAFVELEKEAGIEGMRENTMDEDDFSDEEEGPVKKAAKGKVKETEKERDTDFGKVLQKKRRAQRRIERPSPAKRSRFLLEEKIQDEAINTLEPASEWVLKLFAESGGASVPIMLDYGLHPCKFSRGVLSSFTFLKSLLDQMADETPTDEPIKVPNVSREAFDLAIQWSILKDIKLDPEKYPQRAESRSKEVTAILELVFAGCALGLGNIGTAMDKYIWEILIDQRNSLKGSHIRRVYKLSKGHPLRKLVVQASLWPFMTFQDDGTSSADPYTSYDEDEEVIDEARRSAFGRRFEFQREIDNIPEFKMELFEQVAHTVHTREVVMSRRGKQKGATWFLDPLNGERFTL